MGPECCPAFLCGCSLSLVSEKYMRLSNTVIFEFSILFKHCIATSICCRVNLEAIAASKRSWFRSLKAWLYFLGLCLLTENIDLYFGSHLHAALHPASCNHAQSSKAAIVCVQCIMSITSIRGEKVINWPIIGGEPSPSWSRFLNYPMISSALFEINKATSACGQDIRVT